MSCWTKCNHKRSMDTASNTEDKREKIQALSLAKECYSMKVDLLTNATVVDDAIRFVSSHKITEKVNSSSDGEQDKEESNEPDYDEDEDQLEEKQLWKSQLLTKSSDTDILTVFSFVSSDTLSPECFKNRKISQHK